MSFDFFKQKIEVRKDKFDLIYKIMFNSYNVLLRSLVVGDVKLMDFFTNKFPITYSHFFNKWSISFW